MLQFQCPHCRAVIRVHNSAMGQRGTCQTCGQKILVPVMTEKSRSGLEDTEVILQQEASNELAEPASEQQAVNELLSALSSPEVKPPDDDPILNVVRRGSRSNNSFLLTGLIFLLIGGCGAVAYYYLSQPLMQAELTAQIMPVDAIKPTLIGRHAIQQPELFESFWLKNPGKKIEINSRLLETSILAQKRGLELRLYPGPDNDLYRVDILKNELLREFYASHSAELEEQRKEVLIDAASSFLEQMVVKEDLLRKNSHLLIEIRDRMVLTAMVHGLGFRLVAEVKGKQYPCVWQDKQDRLYFALPKETTHFIIREAKIAGQNKVFPKTMRFDISCPQAIKTASRKIPPESLISTEEKEKEEKGEDKEGTKDETGKESKEGEESETVPKEPVTEENPTEPEPK